MAKKYTIKRLTKLEESRESSIVEVDESKFKINYRQSLNAAQYDAASAVNGCYLIIAGAGTGKTRTLVYRVARLVELGYDPKSILLLTFTRKASKEMMSRASLLLDSRCAKINGGTFHSFANITLRKYAKAIGIDPSFTILDQGDSEDVINLIRGQLKLADKKKRFPNKATINKVISLAVNTNRSIRDVLQEEYPHFIQHISDIERIAFEFDSYKKKNSLLDYDDLLVYLKIFLFEKTNFAASLLSDIKFIMVDEYQDTNYLQAEIIQGLSQYNKNVMVVGDDSQSIYSFRGANFKNIIHFPNLFQNVELIKLEENYRSTQSILDLANHIIDSAVEKYPKNLFTRKLGGELPAIVSATNENMQSRFIVDRILELIEEGVPLSEVAVLFRSSYFSFDLEIELNKANIPFIKFGGMKFIEAAHIKDILAFMRIAVNPRDFVSWYRILLLHEGIGPKKAQQIIDAIANQEIKINVHPEAIISSKYNDRIFSLFELLHKIFTSHKLPIEKAEMIYEYYEPLFHAKYDDFHKRKKDLEIFLNIAENYKNTETFLADMALDPPQDSVMDIEATDKEKEFLTLSTIHSAKGLEWHSVFIIHALEGFFPSSQSYQKIESLEEERRLMYVAATRSKQNLYITYPMNIFDRHQGVTLSKPSRFIEGIDENIAEEWLIQED